MASTVGKVDYKPAHEDALLKLVRDNVPAKNIKLVLGLSTRFTLSEIQRVVRDHNLDYQPVVGGRGKYVSKALPETLQIRINLGRWLTAYSEHFTPNLTPQQLAVATGLTTRAVRRATTRPYDNDWAISEIARFAKALGMTPEELLIDCSTRTGNFIIKLDASKVLRPEQLDQ